ncbi:MAG: hypothetical protein HDR19_03150 [Lachnospiraceae bacterium]|nr:hypothetical protein [Lachnospiraceae bacterium]
MIKKQLMKRIGCFFYAHTNPKLQSFQGFTGGSNTDEVLSGKSIYILVTTLKDFIRFLVENHDFKCWSEFLRLRMERSCRGVESMGKISDINKIQSFRI